MVEAQLLPQLASLANSCRTRERFPRGAGRAGAPRVCHPGVKRSLARAAHRCAEKAHQRGGRGPEEEGPHPGMGE